MSDKERSSLARYYSARGKYFNDVDYRLRVMVRNARARSKLKGHDFNLDVEHLRQLWDECEGRCELTNREFNLILEEHGGISPDCPSLDRIIPELGYIKGNVRLVTYQTNVCLHNFGYDSLMKFANDLIKNSMVI